MQKQLPTIHHHLPSIALWALILERLCCVSRLVLPLPDLFHLLFAGWSTFHINTNSSQVQPNSLQIVSSLCLLARCDWVTVFTGVKWKHVYVNKHWHPEKLYSVLAWVQFFEEFILGWYLVNFHEIWRLCQKYSEPHAISVIP